MPSAYGHEERICRPGCGRYINPLLTQEEYMQKHSVLKTGTPTVQAWYHLLHLCALDKEGVVLVDAEVMRDPKRGRTCHIMAIRRPTPDPGALQCIAYDSGDVMITNFANST
jgi:hypothetical protein